MRTTFIAVCTMRFTINLFGIFITDYLSECSFFWFSLAVKSAINAEYRYLLRSVAVKSMTTCSVIHYRFQVQGSKLNNNKKESKWKYLIINWSQNYV